MSFYNLMHGYNTACLLFLPMLGKHPDEYPRFRDCFVNDEKHPEYDNHILVFTRVGGLNRGCGLGEDKLEEHPNYVATYDDDCDSTFGIYVFSVPDRWERDYFLLMEGRHSEISDEYLDEIKRIYPKLKEILTQLFER